MTEANSTVQANALKALATALPAAFAANNLTDATDLLIWGVSFADFTADSVLSKSQTAVLLKFVKAREFNAKVAEESFIKTLKWRKEFDMQKLATETFPPVFTGLGEVYGKDKAGKIVTYNYYGQISQGEVVNNAALFLRWRVQLMERAIALLDFENGVDTITQIHDYTGASMFLDPKLKATTATIIAVFQDHYPEMLEKKFFCGVPVVAEYIFNLFTFVSARTRDKFIVVSQSSTRKVLLDFINPDQLPPRYGGFEQVMDVQTDDTKKISVPAWSSKKVEVPVKAGDEVILEYAVASMDITIKAQFEPSEDKTPVVAVGGNGKASYVAKQDGLLVITFDNASSFFYEKNVHYRIRVNSSGKASSSAPVESVQSTTATEAVVNEPSAHVEPVTHHEKPVHNEPAHVEPAHVEAAHVEPVVHHEEPVHHEPAHVEATHVESVVHHEESAKEEPAHTKPEQEESAKEEPGHEESVVSEQVTSEAETNDA